MPTPPTYEPNHFASHLIASVSTYAIYTLDVPATLWLLNIKTKVLVYLASKFKNNLILL